MAYEVRFLERVREVPEATWNALVAPDASPFVEWTWLDCLEEAGCVTASAGWLPVHLAIHKAGKLVAALPAYAKSNSEGEFVFDWSWADLASRLGLAYYPKLVAAVPFTPATGDRLLVLPGEDRRGLVDVAVQAVKRWLVATGASGAHVLFPKEDEAHAWREAGFLLRHGFQYHWHNEGYRTFDDFLLALPSKKRTQIRRERAQPEKDGLRLATLGPDDFDDHAVDRMYAFYTDTVDKYFYGRRYLNRRFFDLVTERFRHRMPWVVATRDREIVAGAFNVEKGDRLYGRYWGTSVDLPFLHFNVCYYHGVAYAISKGLRVFEPGAGGEHKHARGFRPTLTYSAHWIEHPRMRGILAEFLARESDAVRAHVLEGS
ncbi:MAG: GNAT family N-acetyltransferase [Polyangiaceae bacterium]